MTEKLSTRLARLQIVDFIDNKRVFVTDELVQQALELEQLREALVAANEMIGRGTFPTEYLSTNGWKAIVLIEEALRQTGGQEGGE